MAKKYLDKNVYEATQERIKYLFEEFDNILIAFSGGKDSSVCLNMVYDYAKKNNQLNKVAMYHLDYEAQYQMTTDYVDETFKRFDNIKRFWLCLPIEAQCCCKMDGGTWTVWDRKKQNIWVREMPQYKYVINEYTCPFDFKKGKSDYEIQEIFCNWFQNTYGKTAVVIGIRADESLNRFRAVTSDKPKKYKNKNWINSNKAYIIYDWCVEDIWVYNAKFLKPYNKLYDLYYQAGLTVDKMRVASPFNDCASESLKLYKVIDPKNWGKMVSRVNGVNFTGLYGGTTAMGWRNITLPKGHTWKSYLNFLLNTLDEKTRKHYVEKFDTSIKFWKEKGGALDSKTIDELNYNDVKFKVREPNNYSVKNTVTFEEYPDDLDVTQFQIVPSYKRMCICILKNDYFCKYMGFSFTKNETKRRKEAMEKYANL